MTPPVQTVAPDESALQSAPAADAPLAVPSSLDLEHLTYADLVACGRVVRQLSASANTSETVASRITQYFYDIFRIPHSGERACVLVRCFQTHPYGRLQDFRKVAADRLLDESIPQEGLLCLTLLATRGIEKAWNAAETSAGHAAIPLPNAEVVRRAPMISRLLLQMGVPLGSLLSSSNGDEEFRFDNAASNFDVFHVERARSSNFIPAQAEFVKPYGVRSVVGIGGLLPTGEIFVVILFARVRITREIAELFRMLALNVKLALIPFSLENVFEDGVA